MHRHFTLDYWFDGMEYLGRLREIPVVYSQGETLSDLEENIRSAYKFMVELEGPLQSADVSSKELGVDM